jgi:Xaa-Pro aminopeptidase
MTHYFAPELPPSIFAERRTRLGESMSLNSACFILGGQLKTRSNDTEYVFRQDSDFMYLTGFLEPDAALLMIKRKDGLHSTIFCAPKDPVAEIWHGRRLGVDAAPQTLKVDTAFSSDDLTTLLPKHLAGVSEVYCLFNQNTAQSILQLAIEQVRKTPKQSFLAPKAVKDISSTIHHLRLLKTSEELQIMRTAGEISADAHKMAMRASKPGLNEGQLEAVLHYHFAIAGARNQAYTSIVGGGDNACILHYTENNQTLQDGTLVLIDAGGELAGYAADITRTFPVNGHFSKPQAQLYQIVLDAQEAALAQCRAGNTLSDIMQASVVVLVTGLCELGILTGSVQDNIDQSTYRDYFMHGIGHYLGLDVHDVGAYKDAYGDLPLVENTVITIEPGVYIAPGSPVPEQYQGIGIRIEDNVVIKADSYEILTNAVPKTIAEIEALMQEPYQHHL